MNTEAIVRLLDLRRRVFTAIGQVMSLGDGGKSYEGTFSIVMPNYWERDDETWTVQLDLYVIGPHRHYDWTAPTLLEAVEKADKEVSGWLAEHDVRWASEGRA